MARERVEIKIVYGKAYENKKENEANDDGRADPAVATLACSEILGGEAVQGLGPRLGGQL